MAVATMIKVRFKLAHSCRLAKVDWLRKFTEYSFTFYVMIRTHTSSVQLICVVVGDDGYSKGVQRYGEIKRREKWSAHTHP